MPKGADTPESIRIRENQKRSRARRKDLIESLQQRVREYELKGINATQEMQIAARKVVHENARLREENARLRALLEVKGVGRGDLERWLKGEEGAVSVSDGVGELVVGNVSEPIAGCEGRRCVDRSFEEFGVRAGMMEDLGPTSSRNGGVVSMRCDGAATEAQRLPGLAARPSSAEAGPFSPGLETSCETASRIIIEISGDNDMDMVRSSLGCRDRGPCSVKNSTVLQIMSDM